MEKETNEWTVRMLADLRGRININAEYQRGKVWSMPQQQLLIDSILRGFDLPKIFLRKLPDGSELLFDVVDGVQRLTSIWCYLADEYSLPESSEYPGLGSVGGKSWSELSQEAKDRLEFAKVTITEIKTAENEDIHELFQRLQKGEPLNAAEKRNSKAGPVRNFVAQKLAKHSLWDHTAIKHQRYGWDEMSAIALALVKVGGATGLKAADLNELYEDKKFDPQGDIAKSTVDILDRLGAVAKEQPRAIRTRWGFVDLLLSLMQLDEDKIESSPSDIMRFFSKFEEERRIGAAELSDLRSTIVELGPEITEEDLNILKIQGDMLAYINAFTHEGASAKNVEVRAEIMSNRLQKYLQDKS